MCTIQTFINFKTSLAITLKISLVIYVSAQSGFLFTFFMACLHRPKRIKKVYASRMHRVPPFPAVCTAFWLRERNKRVFESETDYQNDIKFKAD